MLNLYTETAVDIRSIQGTQQKEIVIPRSSDSGRYDKSKYSKKRQRNNRLANDDKSYAAEYLASSSGVFHRQTQSYPRSFSWRVVANDKILEIFSIDFSRQQENGREIDTVLAFEFPDGVYSRGVSLCDSDVADGFHLFVLTGGNELLELQLKIEFFQNPDSIPADVDSWARPVKSSSLTIDKAFQICATSPYDVFLSFASRGVQHCTRENLDSAWTYANYDEKRWGASLFNIVSRKQHPDIDFEGLRLAYNSAHAMTKCGNYLFTICLNHTLRTWHLSTGRLVDTRDLLDEARAPNELLQLRPAEPGYVQVLEGSNQQEQLLLTHSPINGGQVKLWRIRNAHEDDADSFRIEDAVPGTTLALPDPDPTGGTVWMLAGLKVSFDRHTKDWQMWILWRNNNYHKTYSLNFHLANIDEQWQNDWVNVTASPARALPPDGVPLSTEAIKSKWLEHFFYPGRYSTAVLETALAQYTSMMGSRLPSQLKDKHLKNRLEELINMQVSPRKFDDGTIDEDRVLLDTDKQWRHYWRLLEKLNESRYAPLSLDADSATGAITIAMTDIVASITEASSLDLIRLNTDYDVSQLNEITRSRWTYRKLGFNEKEINQSQTVLKCAQGFYDSFSSDLSHDWLEVLDEEIFQVKTRKPKSERIIEIFDELSMQDAVTEEAENMVHKTLDEIGGIEKLSDKHFESIMHHLIEHKSRHGRSTLEKTTAGLVVTFAGVIREIETIRHVITSLLALIVFVHEDQNDTKIPKVYEKLLHLLREQERSYWLATHFRTSEEDKPAVTILQDIYAHDIPPPPSDNHPFPYLLYRHIEDYVDLISSESSSKHQEKAVFFLCWLLKQNEIELAKEFKKFQSKGSWSSYATGRLSLATGNFDDAAEAFVAAGQEMSGGKALGQLEQLSAGLLTADEASYFYSGLPLYLQNIINLFETKKAYNQVADISRNALDALKNEKKEPRPNFQQNILQRLFQAELNLSNYDAAFEALTQFTDPVLQRASSTELVDTMLKSSSRNDLASTVEHIRNMPLSSYPHILTTIDQHLASLAKKQANMPSASWLTGANTDYLSIVHTLRLSRDDYRGAMSIMFDRLRVVQKSGRARSDPQATALRHALLTLINAMTCVAPGEAYIITDVADDPRLGGKILKRLRTEDTTDQPRKRAKVVITLDDMRKEYQNVLDRCSRIERGDFEFNTADDSGDESDGAWEGSKLQIDEHRGPGALKLNGDAMQLS